MYREDGRGNGSSTQDTLYTLDKENLIPNDFNVAQSISNQRITIEADNINDTDVWLMKLNNAGAVDSIWTKVDPRR